MKSRYLFGFLFLILFSFSGLARADFTAPKAIIQVDQQQFASICQSVCPGMTLRLHKMDGVFVPSPVYASFGMPVFSFKLPTGSGNTQIFNLESSLFSMELKNDRILVRYFGFTENGDELRSPFGPKYDIKNYEIHGALSLVKDVNGISQFVPKITLLQGDVVNPHGALAKSFWEKAKKEFAQMSNKIAQEQIDAYFAQSAVQEAMRMSFLKWAASVTGLEYDYINPKSLEIKAGILQFEVMKILTI